MKSMARTGRKCKNAVIAGHGPTTAKARQAALIASEKMTDFQWKPPVSRMPAKDSRATSIEPRSTGWCGRYPHAGWGASPRRCRRHVPRPRTRRNRRGADRRQAMARACRTAYMARAALLDPR